MRLVITTEYRFHRTPDGAIWTTSVFPYAFWTRYLSVFDCLRVVARVCEVKEPPANAVRSDGENVEFYPIPYYVGPRQLLWMAPRVYTALRHAVTNEDAVIMRIASSLAMLLEPTLSLQHHPYGVEVVGDPYDVFAPGVVEHPLRRLFRWWFTRAQKRQCWNAIGAAYVTKFTLQKRYPCKKRQSAISDVEIGYADTGLWRTFQTFYSSVELTADSYSGETRSRATAAGTLHLILIGTLEQNYKAPDIVISALTQLIRENYDLELVIVGDGRLRQSFEQQARHLGVSDRVFFRGMLPAGQAVRAELAAADLFVLPSRTEGLPRAMIEAMAQGLPCIGSTVGGIPELLPPEDLVPPGDSQALADKIREVLISPNRMQQMSARNLIVAQEYRSEILRERRDDFYQHIRNVTAKWIEARV